MKPNNVLENALVKLGLSVRCLWQQPGPARSNWSWLECLEVRSAHSGVHVIVQTFRQNRADTAGGWAAYIADNASTLGGTIGRVVNAAGGDGMRMLPEIAIVVGEIADAT